MAAATTHKVLIVDDSPSDRELIRAMLHPAFRTLEAHSIESGLDEFRREHPDCVLLDHHMPGASGIDGLIEFVRERAVVVMVSGSDSEELAAEAIKRGAHDFLRKDQLTKRTLLRTITR